MKYGVIDLPNPFVARWERLAEARIEPSVGSVEDSYDNALEEMVIDYTRRR